MQRGRNHSSTFNISVKIIIFLILYFIHILVGSKKVDGFSTELIHINSPLSPFFNPNLTDEGYMEQIGSSPLVYDVSFYLMKISYGTPPVELYHIIDTGSDISWIQCLPRKNFYASDYPPFNPNTSSTFKFENCSTPEKKCTYKIRYVDNAYSRGDWARETITIGSDSHKKEFKNFLFGCGHDNGGGFFPRKGAGIVGFDRQKRSFITQLQTEHNGTFSYCMAPPESKHAGKISFGEEGRVSGSNVTTIPFVDNSDYGIKLIGITFGGIEEKLVVPIELVVDSGTKGTYLPNYVYSNFEEKVKRLIKLKPQVRPEENFKLCYALMRDADIPKIKFHFEGGILNLRPASIFARIGRSYCLVIFPTNESFLLGHLAQVNFLVGFDLVNNKLSFKPTNCAAL